MVQWIFCAGMHNLNDGFYWFCCKQKGIICIRLVYDWIYIFYDSMQPFFSLELTIRQAFFNCIKILKYIWLTNFTIFEKNSMFIKTLRMFEFY
jgi:hypothetical protein